MSNYEIIIPYGVPQITVAEAIETCDVKYVNEENEAPRLVGSLEELQKAEIILKRSLMEQVNRLDSERDNPLKK